MTNEQLVERLRPFIKVKEEKKAKLEEFFSKCLYFKGGYDSEVSAASLPTSFTLDHSIWRMYAVVLSLICTHYLLLTRPILSLTPDVVPRLAQVSHETGTGAQAPGRYFHAILSEALR